MIYVDYMTRWYVNRNDDCGKQLDISGCQKIHARMKDACNSRMMSGLVFSWEIFDSNALWFGSATDRYVLSDTVDFGLEKQMKRD